MVSGILLHPHDSLSTFLERYHPFNIPCPDLFQLTVFQSCPGLGTIKEYNPHTLIVQDFSLLQILQFQLFQPVTEFELCFWFYLPEQFTRDQEVLMKISKTDNELAVLFRKQSRLIIFNETFSGQIQPSTWKLYNQLSLYAFSYGSEAFEETRSTLFLSLNNRQLLQVDTYEFQVSFLFEEILDLSLSPAIILINHEFTPFPRTPLLNNYDYQVKQFCHEKISESFPRERSQYCTDSYSKYCSAIETLPCDENAIKQYCFGSCEVIQPLFIVDTSNPFYSDRRKQFLIQFTVESLFSYSQEIIRRHISLSFQPPERNTFTLKRMVDTGHKISFVVIHDPPIGKKENVKGKLRLIKSYYFRTLGDLNFQWEINEPLTLAQVIEEQSFQICCILKNPSRDTLDYAQDELMNQQRFEVKNGYRVYFEQEYRLAPLTLIQPPSLMKYCFQVSLESPQRMDEEFSVAIYFQESTMLRVDAPQIVLKRNTVSQFLPGGAPTFLQSSFFSFWLLAIFFDMPLKYFWGVINQVQLLQFLLLICVDKPTPLKSVLQALSFINGEFKIVESISSMYNSTIPSEFLLQAPPCYQEADVEHFSVLKNLEHSFWVSVLYFLFIYPLVIICYFIFRRFKCDTGRQKAAHCISIEGIIRFFLELYADLALSFFIGLRNEQDQYGRWITVQIILRLGLLVVLLVLPLTDFKKLKQLRLQKEPQTQDVEQQQEMRDKFKKREKFLKERIIFVVHRFGFCLLLVILISRPSIQIGCLIGLEVIALLLRSIFKVHYNLTELIFSYFESLCFIGYLALFEGLLYVQKEFDYGSILNYSYYMVVIILCSVAISIGFPIFSLLRNLANHLRYSKPRCSGCKRNNLRKCKCCFRVCKRKLVSRVASSRLNRLSLGLPRPTSSASRNGKKEVIIESQESPALHRGKIQRSELTRRFKLRQRSINDCLETVSPRTDAGASPRNFSRGFSSSRGFMAMVSEGGTPRSQAS